MFRLAYFLFALATFLSGCPSRSQAQSSQRIVSLNGTVTEILCELGLQNQIVGTDVTSTYPEAMAKSPKVGHNRNIGAEAVLALRPTIIIGTKTNGSMDVKPEVIQQFRSASVKTVFLDQTSTVAGAKDLINKVAATFGVSAKAPALVKKIDADLTKVRKPAKVQKVLFIYARGAGTLMVAGQDTPIENIIKLAGGTNAATGFTSFKPLTPEALLAANPDVLLLFTSGLESLGGIDGLLKVPGIAQTNAGRNRNVIDMDGQLLTGFSPRLGQAVQQLSQKLTAELSMNK
ncbi:hemin ABC transporter substrate-binding protein [Spirosoma sp. KUDC1026]|uniref:heme/hemin ABC transporter substrate-binding protein n=1 Tax=Spirosoma sp. KUDC1026 TaxID=2745947 RepID=UPI00159BBE5D|nr:ABC transporter substrate-binding protein [Spirosoma sp. KUDC1026]QKZ12170.1 ABC transporter substrate-binding protein [Spirosoma sp. KUDC1026]